MIHLPPQQQQLQAQTSSMKESGGNRKLGVHRLKRERSSADRVVATVIATGSTMNSSAVTGSLQQPAGTFGIAQQPPISFGLQPPDVKRARLTAGMQTTAGAVADFGERLPKFSARSPISLLEEALRSWEAGDRQTGSQRLREFSIEHLRVLPAESHTECAGLLLRLASVGRNNENSEACLRFTLNILQSTSSIHAVWSHIYAVIIGKDEKNDSNILKRVQLDTAVLALFEEAVSNSVVSESQLEIARQVASRSLHSDDFERRIAAIHFYIAYAIKDESTKSVDELLALEKLLCDLCEDRDSRVRFAAIRGISMLSDSRKSLSFYIYSVAKMLSENTEKFVRLEALKILKDFADRQPETEVIGRNNAKLRLVDDAFSVVCHALNDVEVMVRAEAAKLLGTFEFVSDCFVDQTLDKKLLNAMRMSKAWQSASRKPQRWTNVRRERYAASTEWSTGKKLGEDVPAEKIEDEQTSIIPTGACGALITALEDEFMVVRQAAVYSLGRLAADRSFLAAAAIDNLSDMFNDEIEQVRLDAIYALTPLVVHGVLHKEQLDTILTVLDDASPDSREALRVLLMKATLDSPECMRDCVKALLNCLKRFPIDESSIFRCLSDLGRRHGSFIEPLVMELLGLNAVFDMTEPELDDAIYMAKLMLILNAASVHDPLCSLLPEFAIRHYRYLRSSMPDLIPFVRMLSDGDASESDDTSRITKKKAARCETLSLLESLYEKMCDACKMDTFIERSAMLGRLVSDFDGISETDVSIAGTARFVANLVRMLMRYDMALQRLSYFGDFHSVLNVIDEGLELLDHCENEFGSVDATLLGVLSEYRCRFRILKIVTLLDIDPRSNVNVVETINSEMEALKEQLAVLDVQPSESMTQTLSAISEQLEQSSIEKSIIGGRGLLSAFHSGATLIPPDKPSSFGNIDGKWVEIVEPNEPFKDAIRFKAGLPLGVPFNILLHNFNETDVSNFRIKIGYSTQRFTLFRPRQTDIKRLPDQRIYRFMGNILIESNAWSTAGVVRINCVLLLLSREQSCTVASTSAHQTLKQRRNQPNLLSSNNNNLSDDRHLIPMKTTAIKCNSNSKLSSSSLSKCLITLMESPFSNKPASKDIPIYPMTKCSF